MIFCFPEETNNKDRKLLSLYFCAGCPTLEGTGDVIKAMERKGSIEHLFGKITENGLMATYSLLYRDAITNKSI